MMYAVIVASTYEKAVNTADDLLKSGKCIFIWQVYSYLAIGSFRVKKLKKKPTPLKFVFFLHGISLLD